MSTVSSDTRVAYTSPRPDVTACVPPSAIRILDVGCSNGALGASLRDSKNSRHISGIEGSEAFCEEAKTRLDRVIHADLNRFDWREHFGDERFDCMIFADVLEHLVDPWTLLSEGVKYLNQDGLVIVSAPNIRHVSAINSIVLKGTFPRISRGIFDSTHLRWFTFKDLRTLLTGAGLQVVDVSSHMRIQDAPNGRLNHVGRKVLQPLRDVAFIREFFTYQFVVTGRKTGKA